jgi:hypothetical protein
MDRFQQSLAEMESISIDVEESNDSYDLSPIRNRSGQAIIPDAVTVPWWASDEREPGSLFDHAPRGRRAA